MRVALLLLAFGFAALQPGASDGRAGNRRLDAGDDAGAVAAYTNGTVRMAVPDHIAMRLWHNLGVALARDTTRTPGDGDTPAPDSSGVSADSAFAQAIRLAGDPATRARYAYDAGTAALLGGDARLAVALLRRSLVLDPSRRDARRNYEIARRRVRDPEAPPTPPEPSENARRLKAEADRLVAQRRYRAAFDLMTDGLTRDSTVAAYAEFTSRMGEVVDIEEMPEPRTRAAPAPVPPRPERVPEAPAGPTRL